MFSCLEGWLFLPSNPSTEKDRILCKTYLSERLYQCQADCPALKPSMLTLVFQFGPFRRHSNILFCFLNPRPSQKPWVTSCETCQAEQVNQLSYRGKEQAVPPTSPRVHGVAEKNTQNCAEASLPAADASTGIDVILSLCGCISNEPHAIFLPRPWSRAVNAAQALVASTDLHRAVGLALGNLYRQIGIESILQGSSKHGAGDSLVHSRESLS